MMSLMGKRHGDIPVVIRVKNQVRQLVTCEISLSDFSDTFSTFHNTLNI